MQSPRVSPCMNKLSHFTSRIHCQSLFMSTFIHYAQFQYLFTLIYKIDHSQSDIHMNCYIIPGFKMSNFQSRATGVVQCVKKLAFTECIEYTTFFFIFASHVRFKGCINMHKMHIEVCCRCKRNQQKIKLKIRFMHVPLCMQTKHQVHNHIYMR